MIPRTGQREDAVKILHFMNPRNAAEVLDAIKDPKTGAAMVEDFKRLREAEAESGE